MLKLPDGKIWLNEGETVPCTCPCGNVYQPDAGSEYSFCPVCKALNDHATGASYEAVPMIPND